MISGLKRLLRRPANFGIHLLFDLRFGQTTLHNDAAVLMLSVYRLKNAEILCRHVAEATRRRWDVRLWALDNIHSELALHSRGVGPGGKFDLLNSLIEGTRVSEFDWVLVIDDDFVLERGSLALFLALADAADLDLAQPAHGFDSNQTFWLNVCRPLAVARLTTFVEIGPAFAVRRTLADKVLPFPDGFGMGWGLGVKWTDLWRDGARLGIVDWVTINHLFPVAARYNTSPEERRVSAMLRERGQDSLQGMQRTLDTWWPWQTQPRWK